MTSRSLFFKLLNQERKHKIWYPLLIFILLFLAMEMPLLMKLQEMENWPKRYDYGLQHYFANYYLSPDKNFIITGATCLIAVVSAFIMYSYVHFKQQLDLFHSVPVKRGLIFAAKYACGFEFFAVPFLIQMLITFFIASVKHCFSKHALINFVLFFIILAIIYLVIYSLTIVCIMLTGNIVISIVATIILQFYSLLLSILKRMLYSRFFYTNVYEYNTEFWAFSPLDMVGKLIERFDSYRQYNTGISYRISIEYSLIILLAAIIYTVIGFALYKNRKSECAGSAIAFSGLEGMIKFIVVLPMSFFAGCICEDLSAANGFSWFVFGACFCFIIGSIIMEIIFRFDFKAGLNHWYHIVFNGGCIVLAIIILKTDVLGYNAYVPARNEIEYISASIENLFDVHTRLLNGRYQTATEYRMENVKLYDEDTYDLAQMLARLKLYDENNKSDYHSIMFGYHLKNGKTIYRRYFYDLNDDNTKKLVAGIFDSREYKLGSVPILKQAWNKNIEELELDTNYFFGDIKIKEKEKNCFLDVYQKEFIGLTFEEFLTKMPVGSFSLGYKVNGYTNYEGNYPIYDSFEKTIEFFGDNKIAFDKEAFIESVNKVSVTYYDYDHEDFPVVDYEDEEKIRDIIENCISYGVYNLVSEFAPSRSDIDVDACYYDEDGDRNYKYMTFYKKRIPDYVLKDLNIQ